MFVLKSTLLYVFKASGYFLLSYCKHWHLVNYPSSACICHLCWSNFCCFSLPNIFLLIGVTLYMGDNYKTDQNHLRYILWFIDNIVARIVSFQGGNHIITGEATFTDYNSKAHTIPKKNELLFILCFIKIHRFCLHFNYCLFYSISSKTELNIGENFKDDDWFPVLVVSETSF